MTGPQDHGFDGTIPGVTGFTIAELRDVWDAMKRTPGAHGLLEMRLACMAVGLANQYQRRAATGQGSPPNPSPTPAAARDTAVPGAEVGTVVVLDLDGVRDGHVPWPGDEDDGTCSCCGMPHPCVTRRLADEVDTARAEIARLSSEMDERYPCDGLCIEYPEENCSRHGRTPAELWKILVRDTTKLRERAEKAEAQVVAVRALSTECRAALDDHPEFGSASIELQLIEAALGSHCCGLRDRWSNQTCGEPAGHEGPHHAAGIPVEPYGQPDTGGARIRGIAPHSTTRSVPPGPGLPGAGPHGEPAGFCGDVDHDDPCPDCDAPPAAASREEIEHQTSRAEKAEAALGLVLSLGLHGYVAPLPLEYGCALAVRSGERDVPCGAPEDHPVHGAVLPPAAPKDATGSGPTAADVIRDVVGVTTSATIIARLIAHGFTVARQEAVDG